MERVVIVLGGGGVKGLAHIGAWQALEESDLEVSGIVGTSIGALVGACLAGGMGWRDLVPLAMGLRRRDIVSLNGRALLLNGIRQSSLFHGHRLLELIRRLLPVEDYSGLEIPFAMNAVDLGSGQVEWFGTGGRTDHPLAEAIYASCALPLFYPPAELGGRYYVDGGVLDTLPLYYAKVLGADRVIAIDVAAGADSIDGSEPISQGLIGVHSRVFEIMAHLRRHTQIEDWDGPPLLYIRPELDGISAFDFSRSQYLLEEGYRATRRALAGWKEPAPT